MSNLPLIQPTAASSLKIASWNLNSINSRLEQLQEWLLQHNPDIMLLQELKCETDKFPHNALSHLPYNCYVIGQKSYNGVAVLSKFTADEILTELPNSPCKDQARFIEISCNTSIGYCRIISLYAPNGSEVGSDKFEMKLNFYDAFSSYIKDKKTLDEHLMIGGDFNIAPFDIDVYSPKDLQNTTCFTQIEKDKLRTIFNSGFHDLYRLANHSKREFSWWDYRAGAFEQNKGMRIDTIISTSNTANLLKNCYIDYNIRTKNKPSDHAIIVAEFIAKDKAY